MQSQSDQSFDLSYSRCVRQLDWAVVKLEGVADEAHVANTAELIIQTMTGAWRFFHTPEHIFEVGRNGDAIEVLAALFHDAIHIQADNGVSVNIGMLIAPFIRETNKSLKILNADQLPADPVFEMVCMLFDFLPGQTLQPTKGQNEFLSALVAAKSMEKALRLENLAQIAACIEATIPFRPRTPSGLKPAEQLRERLHKLSERFGFAWGDAQLDAAVTRAVRLANRDVENFSHPFAAEFLNNTWNLMPETNHDLLGAYSYTVSGYRKSLQRMERFMAELKPECVFQQYGNTPSDSEFEFMINQTHKNLEVARLYLGCKLLSIAMVEAVSLRLGAEIPLATMMGELPQRGTPDAQLESFLPISQKSAEAKGLLEQEVLDLLEKGRTQDSSYDVKHSPVATFVIRSIGFGNAGRLLERARAFFAGTISGEEFLQSFDADIVEAIVFAVEQVFEVRLKAIRKHAVVA